MRRCTHSDCSDGAVQLEMLTKFLLVTKRKRLMRHFRHYEIKYSAERLGEDMASAKSENSRNYSRERLNKAVRVVCAKRDISGEDFALIEDDLNDYINRLVHTAYLEEEKRQAMRDIVDDRIKIKRVNSTEPRDCAR